MKINIIQYTTITINKWRSRRNPIVQRSETSLSYPLADIHFLLFTLIFISTKDYSKKESS